MPLTPSKTDPRPFQRTRLGLRAVAAACLLAAAPAWASNVLLLLPNHDQALCQAAALRGFNAQWAATQASRPDWPVPELFIERMDQRRLQLSPDQINALGQQLERQYELVPFDRVITFDIPAHQLSNAMASGLSRAQQWHFAGLEGLVSSGQQLLATPGPRAHVEVIQRLLPHTQTLIIVGNQSEQTNQLLADSALTLGLPKVEVWDNNFTWAQLDERAAALGPHHAVLYTGIARDVLNEPSSETGALKRLLAHANAPVFVMKEPLLGSGAVGGYTRSGELVGRAMANAALRLPVDQRVEAYYRPSFDARVLKRWRIGTDALPPDSHLINEDPAWYASGAASSPYLPAVALGLTALAFLLGGITVYSRRKGRELSAALAQTQAERDRIKLATNATQVGIFDAQRGQTPSHWWSDNLEALFGLPSGHAQTAHDLDQVIDPSDLRRIHRLRREASRQTLPGFETDFRIQRPDGETRQMRMVARLFYTPQAHLPHRYLTAVTDVTEERERLRHMADTTSRLSAIVDTSPNGLVAVNGQGLVTLVNPAMCQIFGYTSAELVGQPLDKLIPHVHRNNHGSWMQAFIHSPSQRLMQLGRSVVALRKDGTPIHVEVVLSPLTIDGDRHVQATVTDVSARVQAQAISERLSEVLQRSNDIVVTVNLNDRLLFANQRGREVLGLPLDLPDDALGDHVFSLAWPDQQAKEYAFIEAIEEGMWSGVSALRTAADEDLPVAVQLMMHRDTQGNPAFATLLMRDLTLERATLLSMQEAAIAADRANRAKSDFLANMSHEIRTPLNAVMGLSHLLEQTPLSDDQRKQMAKIRTASQTLLGVVNDVLDLSKIEAGEMDLEAIAFEPAALLQAVADMASPLAQVKKLQLLTLPLPDNLPRVLLGDPQRLRQILINLCNNAIKFTQQGHVTLGIAHAQPTGPDQWRVRLEVMDTGIGISPEQRSRLFTAFEQADVSTTRRFGGTGLGLAIIKELAELMHGACGVDSELGQGSTFWVEVQLSAAPAGSVAEPLAYAPTTTGLPMAGANQLQGVRVLLVDDSDMNCDVAGAMLTREGAQVSTANNGQAALDWLAAQTELPDVVLMDVQMPVMDGNTAVRHLRSDPRLKALPVVALTANALLSERERSLAAGMDDYLTKPLNPVQLVQTVRTHVLRTQPHRVLPSTTLTPADLPQRPPSVAWPRIEGIWTEDAMLRLGHDQPEMMLRQLDRLLREFDDLLAQPPQPLADEATLKALAARLHKLIGNAGLIGARDVSSHARAAEQAAKSGDLGETVAAWPNLQAAWRKLAQSGRAALAAKDPTAPSNGTPAGAPSTVAPAAPSLDAEALAELVSALELQKFSAVSQYADLRDSLAGVLDATTLSTLDNAMSDLDFVLAHTLLSPL